MIDKDVEKTEEGISRISRISMDTNKKIKAMLSAKCSISGCEEKQFIFMGLASPMGNDIQETFPFCEEHHLDIMFGNLKKFTLKNGYIYGQKPSTASPDQLDVR